MWWTTRQHRTLTSRHRTSNPVLCHQGATSDCPGDASTQSPLVPNMAHPGNSWSVKPSSPYFLVKPSGLAWSCMVLHGLAVLPLLESFCHQSLFQLSCHTMSIVAVQLAVQCIEPQSFIIFLSSWRNRFLDASQRSEFTWVSVTYDNIHPNHSTYHIKSWNESKHGAFRAYTAHNAS